MSTLYATRSRHRRTVLQRARRRAGTRTCRRRSGLKRIIREPTVNRPGLALTGFTRYFANKRIQVIGNAEAYFLQSLPARGAGRTLRDFLLLPDSLRRLLPQPAPGQAVSGGGGAGPRADFPLPDGDDEVHQPRHPRAGNDVRAARHGNGQHGGHPGRGRASSAAKAASAKARASWRSSSAATAWWPTT